MTSLVCLHGFTGDPRAWEAVLAALPEGVRACCPPLVGHDPGIPLTGTSFVDEVDRLAASLARGGDRCRHLAGYSLGARLALGLLVRHRRRFASATLIGVHPGLGTASERLARRLADEALARQLEDEGIGSFVDHWQSLPLFESQGALPPAVLENQRIRRLGHQAAGLAHALRALSLGSMPDYRRQLLELDLPIRLMAGERDEKFRRIAEAMATALPRGKVEIVPGVGHNLVLEAPRAVAAALVASQLETTAPLNQPCGIRRR